MPNGRPCGKRPLGRVCWDDNIKIDLRGIECKHVNWTELVQGPVVGICEHGEEFWVQ